MRTGCIMALLASLLGCCASFKAVTRPPGEPAPPVVASKPPPPLPPRHLACIDHPRIDLWEHRLRSHAELRTGVQQSMQRARWYLPRFRRILSKAGLPPSLALLPVVESEFHRLARGQGDDLGLWQFRGATAREFGLVVNERRDQRLHPYRASRAAARYLRHLHRHYRGDWPLALAAYNAGQRRVDLALARQPNATFWQLTDRGYLPATSREYVPRFLAVVRVVDGKQLCRLPPSRVVGRNTDVVVDPSRGALTQARR